MRSHVRRPPDGDATRDELAHLLDLERQGGYSDGDFMAALVDLGVRHDPVALVGALDEPLAARFVAWARATYDNDVPAEQFFHVGPAPRSGEAVAAQVRRVRAWLSHPPRAASIPR